MHRCWRTRCRAPRVLRAGLARCVPGLRAGPTAAVSAPMPCLPRTSRTGACASVRGPGPLWAPATCAGAPSRRHDGAGSSAVAAGVHAAARGALPRLSVRLTGHRPTNRGASAAPTRLRVAIRGYGRLKVRKQPEVQSLLLELPLDSFARHTRQVALPHESASAAPRTVASRPVHLHCAPAPLNLSADTGASSDCAVSVPRVNHSSEVAASCGPTSREAPG